MMRAPDFLLLPALLGALAACGPQPERAASPPSATVEHALVASAPDTLLVDATQRAGIDFVHENGADGGFHFPEINGAGAALFDMDGDGDLDAYLVSSGKIHGDGSIDPGVGALLRNELIPEGALRFTDVTSASGLAPRGYGQGVAVGDVDGDGDPDLYLTAWGSDSLWRNEGAGRFTDVTDDAGVGDDGWSISAAFTDLDGDGDLDLYVGRYVDYRATPEPSCKSASLGGPDYCGPFAFLPQHDLLYVNQGGGRFEDRSSQVTAGPPGPAMGVATLAVSASGPAAIYVGNDLQPNKLLMSGTDGGWTDRGLASGLAVNQDGKPEASMGIAVADMDGDCDEDLYVTHLVQETNTLYVAEGDAFFRDATVEHGLAGPVRELTGFGTGWLDLDGDGRLDLFVANGAVKIKESLLRAGDPAPYRERNQIFLRRGVSFVEVKGGNGLEQLEAGRGVALGDVDDDGDVDLLVSNNGGPAQLLLSGGAAGSWLGLRVLDGAGRDAIGAKIRVVTDGPAFCRRVATDGSFASASDSRIVVRLGDHHAERVEVTWPGGASEVFEVAEIDRYLTLRPGRDR